MMISLFLKASFILQFICNIEFSIASQCACATDYVHVRSGAGTTHHILGTLSTGSCVTFKEHMMSATGYQWANVDYHGQNGWIASNYLTFKECSQSSSTHSTAGCPTIISRSEWGARTPTHHNGRLPTTPGHVYIHHGATPGCHTKADCIQRVQSYQNYHMDSHGWSDIGYSFVIGEDGNVYEGRGWDTVGAHTLHHNTDGLGFCVMGNFMTHAPNDLAINAVKSLIHCGVQMGKITHNYVLKGHRDVGQTACPGDKLYALIKTWPHYHH
eukprot:XP_011420323.1 PREDICTED: peptidoglycan-recognition protein SC2 isoform X1 [Crassostrea gigas]